jgi:MSHA biogenesis protein MshN
MSLINQMLQDLDKRRVGEPGALNTAEANEIRTVAAQKRSSPIWKIAALCLLLVAGMLAWMLWQQAAPPIKPAPAPVAAKPAEPAVNLPALKTDAQLETLPAPAAEQAAAVTPAPLPQAVQPAAPEKTEPPRISAKPKAFEHTSVQKQEKELSPQQRAENEYRKAIGLTQQGRLSEAMDSLQQATKLDPFHLSARQMLVALLVDGKRPAEAEQILQEALKISPEQSGFAMLLARLQASRGDANAALETLRKGLPHAGGKAEYQALYAALLQRQERHAEAIEHYQAALRQAPGSGVWLMGMGISLQAEKRDKEAEDAFTRAKLSGTLSSDLKAFVEQRLKQLR